MDKHPRLLAWRHSATSNTEAARASALLAKKYLCLSITGRHLYHGIIEDYLRAEEDIAWDVWQELASTSRTHPDILRELHRKRRWYLDILLVNLERCPRDILESLAALPVEKTWNLADKNKEIRDIARKRLELTEASRRRGAP